MLINYTFERKCSKINKNETVNNHGLCVQAEEGVGNR